MDDFDEHALTDEEEIMPMKMANTPDEHDEMLKNDYTYTKSSTLQATIRQVWGETAYLEAQKK